MPIYQYTAVDSRGKIQTGELEEATSRAVADFLRRQELVPVKIEVKKTKAGRLIWLALTGSLGIFEKMALVRNLHTMLKAGLAIDEAIDILLEEAEKPVLKKILTEAKFDLERGQLLSVTFSRYPRIFPPVFINLIKAGEETGTLENALEQLEIQLTKDYELRQKIKSAMFYPVLLFVASSFVIMLLFVFVLPRLASAFFRAGVDLPFFTRLIVRIGAFLGKMPILSLLVFAGVVFGLWSARKTLAGKRFISWISGRIPMIKILVKKIYLARFCRTLSTLLAAGAQILDAVKMTSEAIGNRRYEEELLAAKEEINRGVSLANALRNRPKFFPKFVSNMVMVGERSGELDSMLQKLADHYEADVDNTLKNLTATLEPILLLIMGAVVAIIAISVLLPIYTLIGAVR